jgi:large subunit ribosomal protein L3
MSVRASSFFYMSGLVAQKISMTQIARGDALVAVTLLRVPQLSIAQIKTSDKDGYSALVLDAKNAKGKTVKRKEVPYDTSAAMNVGDALDVSSLEGVAAVKLTSVSKGKGFTGAMKRWNFKGGPGGHGSKFHRALGSIGCRKPRRTKPGKKMHGRHGFKTTTLASVPVELIDREHNIIAVRGPVPGAFNTFVYLVF